MWWWRRWRLAVVEVVLRRRLARAGRRALGTLLGGRRSGVGEVEAGTHTSLSRISVVGVVVTTEPRARETRKAVALPLHLPRWLMEADPCAVAAPLAGAVARVLGLSLGTGASRAPSAARHTLPKGTGCAASPSISPRGMLATGSPRRQRPRSAGESARAHAAVWRRQRRTVNAGSRRRGGRIWRAGT